MNSANETPQMWQTLRGHVQNVERLRRALQGGRLASSFLFVGPSGVGKRTVALRLAQTLLCEARSEHEFEPCGRCPGCIQVQAATHPDLILVAKPPDKSLLPLELFIGERDKRMREGLCYELSRKAFRGGYKVAIVDDADYLNQEGANCLLKTLEEPPPQTVIILLGTSEQRQLPTIRSRCQVLRFQCLSDRELAELAVITGLAEDPNAAVQLAPHAGGTLDGFRALTVPAAMECRARTWHWLSMPAFDTVDAARDLGQLVDEAGKDSAPRRARLRLLVDAACAWFHALIHRDLESPEDGDRTPPELQDTRGAWPQDPEAAALALHRCLTALDQIDANAHPATLLDCWLDDLSAIQQGRSL